MNDSVRLDAVQRWLDTPLFTGSMANAVMSDVESVTAPARADVSGANGRTAMLAGDKALQAAGSDREKLTEALISNPILGATSVLSLAMASSGYNPLLPDTGGNAEAFSRYSKKIIDAPFFHVNMADKKELVQKTKDWDKLIGDIIELFDGITGEDRTRIINGLKKLAHSATSTKDEKQVTNLFCQQVLSVDTASKVTVGIYNSRVEMVMHDGKHTTRQGNFTINRVLLTFDTGSWPIFAGKVAAKKCTSVTEWLESADTLGGR